MQTGNPYMNTPHAFTYLSPVPAEWNTDYSHFLRGEAAGVITGWSEEGLNDCLSLSNVSHPITFRSGGHSCGGICIAKRGSLLNYGSAEVPPVLAIDEENLTATISTGSSWGDVERELRRRNFRVPVLPDFMKLTAGGTLSVGGIGVESIRNGFQADLLEGATIQLPERGKVFCSRDRESELFRFSAGATGNAGLIRDAIIRIGQADDKVRIFKKQVEGLTRLSQWISDPLFYNHPAIRHFQAWYSNGSSVCEAGDFLSGISGPIESVEVDPFFRSGWDEMEILESPYPFSLSRRRENWMAGFHDPIHIWSDFFFQPEDFHRFLTYLDKIRIGGDPRFALLKAIYILIVRRPENPHPSPFLPGKPGEVLFSAGLYSMAHRMDPLEIGTCIQFMTELSRAARDMGGALYQYGFPGPGHSESESSPFHASSFASLREFRSRYGLEGTGSMAQI